MHNTAECIILHKILSVTAAHSNRQPSPPLVAQIFSSCVLLWHSTSDWWRSPRRDWARTLSLLPSVSSRAPAPSHHHLWVSGMCWSMCKGFGVNGLSPARVTSAHRQRFSPGWWNSGNALAHKLHWGPFFRVFLFLNTRGGASPTRKRWKWCRWLVWHMNFSRSPYPWSITHTQPTGSRRAAPLMIDLQMNQLNTSPLLHHWQHRCSYPRGRDGYGNETQEMYRIPFGATASICVSTSEPRSLPGDTAHQEWFRPHCTVITILMNTFGL